MISIGGMFRFDEAQVNPHWLASLRFQLANGEFVVGSQVLSGPVGMVAVEFRNQHTQHTLICRRGEMLAGDLRIDNREEILSLLKQELRDAENEVADVEIIAAAYRQLGLDFFSQLIGEHALALYDSHNRTLVLARDHIGARPLYWHTNANRIVWSTKIGPILDMIDSREVEDEYVAGHLTLCPEAGLTPFKNVHLVKPAHVMVVESDGRIRERRFWGLEPSREIRYQRDEQYEEHCRNLLFEAVGSPLKRADGPVFAELSGGLDSSSIVCVADQILKQRGAKATALQTISHVFDDSPKSDERTFILCVERQIGRRGHHLSDERYRFLAPFPDESSITILNSIILAHAYHHAASQLMQASGARILLTGHGGDEIMCSAPNPSSELSDLLVQFRLGELRNRIAIWADVLKTPYIELLWRNGIMPALPGPLQMAFKREASKTIPPWFRKDFVRRMHLVERMKGPKDIFGFRLPSGRLQSIPYQGLVNNISGCFRQEMAPIEVNCPYLHRPLVEFMQAIPFEQKVRPGETRSLLRRALRGVLPKEIAERRDKGNPKQAIYRGIIRELSSLRAMFDDALVYRRGYIIREEFLKALENIRHGCESNTAAVIVTISLEFWLRAQEAQKTKGQRRLEVTEQLLSLPVRKMEANVAAAL